MAVIAHIVLPGATREQYDQVRQICGWLNNPPTGGLSHVTWWQGSENHNLDAWESEDAFNNFVETRLGPAMAQAGVNIQPQVTFYPAHEVFAPAAITRTA